MEGKRVRRPPRPHTRRQGKHTRAPGLDRYGIESNGFVEVAWGKVIVWPPRHHSDVVVAQLTEGECDFLNTDETGPRPLRIRRHPP